jgi:hypothetical protein
MNDYSGKDLEGSSHHIVDVLAQNLFGGTEEYDETPQSALQVTHAIFEPCASRVGAYNLVFRPTCPVSVVGIHVRNFVFYLPVHFFK